MAVNAPSGAWLQSVHQKLELLLGADDSQPTPEYLS